MASANLSGTPASDLLRSSFNGVNGVPLKILGRSMGVRMTRSKNSASKVVAKIKKVKKREYPWPDKIDPDADVEGGVLSYVSHFKPLKEKTKPVTLPFEKPLLDLEKKIDDVKKMAAEMDLDFTQQLSTLEAKYQQARKDLYTQLSPIQRVSIARHPNRPTFLDHVLNITDKWFELHGDRAGYDDPAIVTGLGSIEGKTYMFIGHQKGRNTKENIKRNFGMPTPHGYRKALRMMYYADHHGFPIITFIDTPGAFADLKSEELGQGEAIAHNLRTMFGLKVPIVSVVIGEGGSGGALAIGCANKLLMLENAVFYVASPEACAAILWKSAKAAPKAAEKLRITAQELCKMKIADGIIPEPLGGAHSDPDWTSKQIKTAVLEAMNELLMMDTPNLLDHRKLKFRHIGGFLEVHPAKAVNVKKKDSDIKKKDSDIKKKDVSIAQTKKKIVSSETALDVKKLKEQVVKAVSSSQPVDLNLDQVVGKLKKAVNQEMTKAVNSMGLLDRLKNLRAEVTMASNSPDLQIDTSLAEKIEKMKHEIKRGLSESPSYPSISEKLDLLKEIRKAQKISETNERIVSMKKEINERLMGVIDQPDIKQKLENLKLEFANSGVSKASDLDDELKEKIFKVKRDMESEIAKALSSLNLNVDLVALKRTIPSNLAEGSIDDQLKTEINELNQEIKEAIAGVVVSSDLKNEIELLKFEIAKAGKSPDSETSIRIEAMKQHIKQAIAKKIESSSSLVEKLSDLKHKIERSSLGSVSELNSSSSSSNGALTQKVTSFEHGESRVDVNLGATNVN